MKKYLLFFVFLLGAFSGILAQTITVQLSGTVLRDSTNAPVPNHEVIIQADSNSYGFTFYTTRFTNASGYYDCYIHNVPTTGTAVTFVVKTKDCDSTYLIQTFQATATPVTVNFLLCNVNNTGCQAGFHSVLDSASAHLVHFYNYSTSSTGNIITWIWDFGDGNSTTITFPANPNVSHTYLGANLTYTVCLMISTDDSCTSQVCHDVTVGQNSGCQAHYNFQTDSVNVLKIHFWDTSTPANLITSRCWNFGDPASGASNVSTTYDPWHTYTQPGIYNVCLSISTSTGCSSTFCDSIIVGSNTTNCENWITYTSSGLTFTFEGHTHSPYPTTYTWNFGDGTPTITGQVVQHIYVVSGSYTITLHTIDSTGCGWNRTQTICAHATCNLYGTAFLSNSLTVDHGLAELIRVDSGMMVIADSMEFGDSAGTYWFNGVLPGHYYIKASLLPSSAYYGQYVPTYHFDAVNWGNATLIELGQPNNPYYIHMHHVNGYSQGSGKISGTITQNGKYNGSGPPAQDVEVLLMDASDQVLAYTMTNANGEFSFPAIAFGTYKVYPEIIEKTTNPSTVILDATHTDVNVAFGIQGSNISGIRNEALPGNFTVSDISPNPVTDYASLTISTTHGTGIAIGIYSITGQAVREIQVALRQGTNKVNIPVTDLTKGLYYVKIERPDGGFVVKKFVLGR